MESGKENIQIMEPLPQTPKRAPFQELGNTQSKSATPMFLKRAQYSQVTPFYTPPIKTPLRKKVHVPCAMRILSDSADVPLNSLIYKKVIGIITEKEKEHEQVMEEKDAEISRLYRQLQMMSMPQDNLNTSATKSSSLPDPSTPDTVDCGCSPYPTPTPLFPKQVPQGPSSLSTNTTNLTKSDNVPLSPHVTSEDVSGKDDSFSFLPQLDSLCSLELDSLCALDLGKSWLDDENGPLSSLDVRDIDTSLPGNTSVAKDSVGVQTSPQTNTIHRSQDPARCATSVQTCTAETMTSPCEVRKASQNTTPLCTATSETMMTPIKVNSVSANTTPKTSHSQGTCRTPLTTTHVETMVTPVRLTSVGSCTSPRLTRTQETNTNQIYGVDAETMVRQVSCDATSQCDALIRMHSQETCTTPPRQMVDCATLTDPVCHAVPRPSEIDFSSLGMNDLALRLESASVSNTLLRGQIDALSQEKSSALRKVALTSVEQRQWEEERARLEVEAARREKLAKMEVTTQVEELMEQQAQMLAQISGLQAQVEHKESVIAEVKASHDQQKAALNAELANLRKDLVTAYQQRKQQVEELKTRYTATDYKPHYERARHTVQLLESQLAAFTGLTEEIRQSQQLQETAADLVSRRAREVEEKMALVNQHFKQHREWEQQRKDIEEELSSRKEKMSGSETELERLGEQLSQAKESVTQLTEQLEKSQDQEKVHFVEQETLKAALRIQEEETKTLKESLSAKTSEVSGVTKDMCDLRAASNIQTERLSRLSQERDRYMNLSSQQRTSLITLRAGARRAEELEVELENLRKEHAFLTTESTVHLEEDSRSQQRMTELQEESEQVKAQLSQAQDELEATRALHLMMLQRREDEMQMSVSAFDGLTEKLTLLQTRIGFCHLQCSSNTQTNTQTEQDDSSQSHAEKNSRKSVRKSFISSILSAVNGDSPTVNIPTTIADVEESGDGDSVEEAETNPLHVRITELGQTLEELLGAVQRVADDLGEVATLRTELEQLQQLTETQTATIDRYKNQKIKLNYNWKMAETELKNLEKLIETVREVLCSHESEIRSSWRESNRLHRLGMFSSDDTTKLLQYDPESLTKTC